MERTICIQARIKFLQKLMSYKQLEVGRNFAKLIPVRELKYSIRANSARRTVTYVCGLR